MSRTKRAIRRKNDIKKARRKQALDRAKTYSGELAFDNLHQYSKDAPKIRGVKRKTTNKFYGAKFNPSASDMKRLDRMNYMEDGDV